MSQITSETFAEWSNVLIYPIVGLTFLIHCWRRFALSSLLKATAASCTLAFGMIVIYILLATRELNFQYSQLWEYATLFFTLRDWASLALVLASYPLACIAAAPADRYMGQALHSVRRVEWSRVASSFLKSITPATTFTPIRTVAGIRGQKHRETGDGESQNKALHLTSPAHGAVISMQSSDVEVIGQRTRDPVHLAMSPILKEALVRGSTTYHWGWLPATIPDANGSPVLIWFPTRTLPQRILLGWGLFKLASFACVSFAFIFFTPPWVQEVIDMSNAGFYGALRIIIAKTTGY